MDFTIERIQKIELTERAETLRRRMLDEPRYVSVEQAKLITKAYREHPDDSVILKRAHALREALYHMEIRIDEGELIVGNRTKESCGGVVFPEGGVKWLEREIDSLETRPQDRFIVRPEDRAYFFEELVPFWEGKTLENKIGGDLTGEMKTCEIVGKLNQKDHAQGHICPDAAGWLASGPLGLMKKAEEKLKGASREQRDYYQAVIMVMEASARFIERYAELAERYAAEITRDDEAARIRKADYAKIASVCRRLSREPAESFHDALQSLWFLMVLLEMESNASSFSPGRADQFLYPYFRRDFDQGRLSYEQAQELLDLLFIKFNQIVYLRNAEGAEFFAGFPIGFNISLGGQSAGGKDAVNELTYLFLRAQEHVRLRQPNLSARLHRRSPHAYMRRAAEVISAGTGMPQLVNDESIIPAMEQAGYSHDDSVNYAVIGCVELSVSGSALSFSDAGMFNMVKVLELTLNNGVDMRTGKQIGPALGNLTDYKTFEDLESAYARELDYFIDVMEGGLRVVEKYHREMMPSPILSSVINDCIDRGVDVTAGGARYNKSGIQLIQVANLADSMAALRKLVYEEKKIDPALLLENLRNNFPAEDFRQFLLNHAPKYGNDVPWVDEIGEKWIEYVKARFDRFTNYRGGNYTIGLYTVSAHVPMGKNVGATPDGRRAGEPLADGGMSAVYGRDQQGPTALLKSVSRIKSINAANGTLLNMKFAPSFFHTGEGIEKFTALMRSLVELKINHVQFNVINKEDLIAAKKHPENYRHLLVRVAGYTANYVDLADVLQDEIIARTEYGF
jgi:formate C-acetyltransferase